MRTTLHALHIGGAVCALLLLGACSKGEKPAASASGSTTASAGADTTGAKSSASFPITHFTGDLKLAVEGRQLFLKYNCYSCHGGLAGGAMGPSLRDSTWAYGGTDTLIHNSIHDGRPLGMPHWGGTLSDHQIGALVMYIKSLRTNAEPKFFFAADGDSAVAAANALSVAPPKP
jgi:mono/diheme cytochrome c family protein